MEELPMIALIVAAIIIWFIFKKDSEKRNPKTKRTMEYSPKMLFDIGEKYYYGNGVEQSYEKAVEWYEKAANQGHAKGQFNLGTMYYNGRGVPKNNEKAKALFVNAAQNGNSDAQTVLTKLERSTQEKYNKVNNDVAQSVLSLRERAQKSQVLFNKAKEQKRNGQYQAALITYKQSYEAYPDNPDVQSTMYAMAKVYLLIGDYEKSCALFQDGLTMKLAQTDERVAQFYKKYLQDIFTGNLNESDSEFVWFKNLTADYSIFIGLTHYLLENNGAKLLDQYRYDFINHVKSVAGKPAELPSRGYLVTCYEYGWPRVLAIASESSDRFDKFDLGHIQKRQLCQSLYFKQTTAS